MKEKKEREREERKRGKENRDRRRRKGERKKKKRKAVFRRSKLVRARSNVRIFDEGCAPRGRDSSYLGFFLSFELLFWLAFRTTLCHVYGLFCSINWNRAHFAVSIKTGVSTHFRSDPIGGSESNSEALAKFIYQAYLI